MDNNLLHLPLTAGCEQCGHQRIESSFWLDGKFYFVITCVECDAPSPDEPFAD